MSSRGINVSAFSSLISIALKALIIAYKQLAYIRLAFLIIRLRALVFSLSYAKAL
jgi:hypothetical protein